MRWTYPGEFDRDTGSERVRDTWRHRTRTVARVYRAHGVRGAAFLGAQHVAPSPTIQLEWFNLLDKRVDKGVRLDPNGDVRWASPADASRLAAAFDRSEHLLRRRFAAGDRCAVLQRDDQVLAYVWFRVGRYADQGIVFEPGPGEGWVYDGMVARDHRGRRLFQILRVAAGEDLAVDGITRLISAIDVLNTPSMKAALRHGARPFGSILLLRAFGVSLRREARSGSASWSLYRGTWPASVAAGATIAASSSLPS